MTQLEHSLLYRADWAWQRGSEGLLALRYYWWCIQCATFVGIPAAYRSGGLKGVVVGLGVNPLYFHVERHGIKTCPHGESATPLIIILRRERAVRERAMFLGSFEAQPVTDSGFRQGRPLHPLMHNDRNPWPSVQGRATVFYPCDDTILLFPQVWPEPIQDHERIPA